MCYQRRELFEYLHGKGKLSRAIKPDIVEFFQPNLNQCFKDTDQPVALCLKNVVHPMKRRWATANRNRVRFLQNCRTWFDKKECLPSPVCRASDSGPGAGRRPLLFTAKGRRGKLLATSKIRHERSSAELVFAASSAVHQEGRRLASKLLEEAGSPRRGGSLVKRISAMRETHGTCTEEQALSIMVDVGLTKAHYTSLQQKAKRLGCYLLPNYG